MEVKSENEVTQLFLIPSDPMDCSLSGSSVHVIFQARILECVPLPSTKKLAGKDKQAVLFYYNKDKLMLQYANRPWEYGSSVGGNILCITINLFNYDHNMH